MSSGCLWSGRSRGALPVVVVVLGLLVFSGCSLLGDKSAPGEENPAMESPSLEEAELPAASSLEQFEATGEVVSGGEFRDVNFAFDSVELDEVAREAVAANAAILKNNPDIRVEIEGHCDDRGTSQYNLALGARRAKILRDALIAEGVSASRLSTVSYGEELPLCKEANEECWARNRRGHLVDLTRQ